MAELYPDPPHLTIAIYSERPEPETFVRMHGVAQKFGCQPLNVIEVAPAGQEFELISDLGAAREVLRVNPAEYAALVAGQDPEVRVLRAAARHRKLGDVLIEYVQKTGPGMHPIAVSMSAGTLGIPVSLWSADQRRKAYSAGDWCRTLLEVASSRCRAVYGAIGVEFSLPTPWHISRKGARLPTELFISHELLDRNGATEAELRRVFSTGDTLTWDNGIYLSGWAPFNPKRATISDPTAVTANSLGALRPALTRRVGGI